MTRHVLLIDAETYAWDVVRHALGEGLRTSAAAFNSTALRILNEDPPDVIIVDLSTLGLPIAVFGMRRRIPVVMTTGNHGLRLRLTRLGCVVLHKPHAPAELRECVADALRDPGGNVLRHRAALERIENDHREREAVLRLFGNMRDAALLALNSTHDQ
jgi:DNA-binding response OmpR family regulator